MREDLALKYRPVRFEDVVGQRPVAATLYRMVHLGTVPQALLFTGNRGCGKTSTARILGMALNCTEERKPCGSCASCKAVAGQTSLAVLEVDAASNGGVAEVRELRNMVQYGSPGSHRVVMLDEAHAMSGPAFNALLKVLEEPPPGTVFVLLTTEESKIMGTVASRCMRFGFDRIPVAAIYGRLQEICAAEGVQAEPQMLQAIAERADGGMRDAVKALDQALSAGIRDYATYAALRGESDFAPGLVVAMAKGDHADLFAGLDEVLSRTGDFGKVSSALVRCLRDLLVLQSSGALACQGHALSVRQALAQRLTPAQVVAALRVMWDLKTKVRATDPRAALELAVTMCATALGPKPRTAVLAAVPQAPPAAAGAPATLDQLTAAFTS